MNTQQRYIASHATGETVAILASTESEAKAKLKAWLLATHENAGVKLTVEEAEEFLDGEWEMWEDDEDIDMYVY